MTPLDTNDTSRIRVVITGMGAVTPVGNTAAHTWEGLITGRPGGNMISLFDTAECDVKIACEVKDFDPAAHLNAKEARKLDRFSQFALVAAREAITQAELPINDSNTHRIAVYAGSAMGGTTALTNEHRTMLNKGVRRVGPFAVPMLLSDAACGQISIAFGIRGPNLNIVSACASAANAIGEATELIRAGRVDAAIAGGSEAPVNPFTLTAFNNMGALSGRNDDPTHASRPFDKTRDGFVAGEGAAFVVIESLTHAVQRGARILGEIIGYGVSSDASHITNPNVTGAAMSMRLALAQAQLAPEQIDYINAHGTSTPVNDSNESAAIKAVFGEHATRVPISSTKSMTGHMLGATGAVEAIACVQAIQHGVVPPTINYREPDPACDLNYVPNGAMKADVNVAMSNSFGFFGHNACLIFRRFMGE
jgi:3-oxoacyl-[acyl-carrier-protein] synthase II